MYNKTRTTLSPLTPQSPETANSGDLQYSIWHESLHVISTLNYFTNEAIDGEIVLHCLFSTSQISFFAWNQQEILKPILGDSFLFDCRHQQQNSSLKQAPAIRASIILRN